MLEVAQLLKQSPPARPVTLLFNEGEEYGLNGAAAFVATDPLAKQINSLINIDTRGVSGPALMYETSWPNGAAVAAYARSTHAPYANSISTDFAKLIPNTTDVVKFAPAGWTLMNWGIIGNETRYHSPGDTIATLDRATVHHAGSEVYAATRTFSNMPDPARAGSGRMVFTSIAGRAFIRLPLMVAGAGLALLLLIAALLAWRRKAVGKPLLLAAGMFVGALPPPPSWPSSPASCATAIIGGPIRWFPILPSTPPCWWQWPRSGGAGAAALIANGCAPLPGCSS
jgi:hypothetical protein